MLLRWGAILVGCIALFFVPALRATVALLGLGASESWTVLALARANDLSRSITQARSLQQTFAPDRASGWFTWAHLLPALAIAAGICLLLCVAAEPWSRRRIARVPAIAGLAAVVLLLLACWRLSHGMVTMQPEPGLYLLGLAFLILLVAPPPHRAA